MKPKRKPERFPLRVVKGALAPADPSTAARLRERGYRVGDVVFAEFKRPRSPKFWGVAHRLGTLCAENIERFAGVDAHRVLKLLQLETGIGCDLYAIHVPGYGLAEHRVPRSLSYESMEEGEFRQVMRGFSRHIAATYWPTLTAEEIEQMAQMMVGE